MKTQEHYAKVVMSVMLVVCSISVLAEPMGTAFTYQGRLLDDNTAADGLYDMQFTLHDAPDSAVPVGSPVYLDDVAVADGYFIAVLDFGVGAFDGSAHWLQIAVRPGLSTEEYTVLTPMQPVTPVPYAIHAGSGGAGLWAANGNDISNTNSGNVGIGTTAPVWELEVANQRAGEGAEVGVTANDASGAIAAYSGTLGDPFAHYAGRVSVFAGLETPGLDLRADGAGGDIRFYTGGPWSTSEHMRIDSSGKVGIGTTSPSALLEVHSPDISSLVRLKTDQTYGYMQFLEGSTPRAYLGFGDDGDILNNAENNSFVIDALGSAMHLAVDSDARKGITIDTDGNVGIGITTPAGKLQVTGDQVCIGGTSYNHIATDSGDLYVENDLEVDGTIYGTVSNMPGCEFDSFPNYFNVPSSWTNVGSISLTLPEPGFVIVTFSGIAVMDVPDNVGVSIGIDPNPILGIRYGSCSSNVEADIPFSIQYVHQISDGGTYTFYGNGYSWQSQGDLWHMYMTAIYVPIRY